jgi:hypothetical protein
VGTPWLRISDLASSSTHGRGAQLRGSCRCQIHARSRRRPDFAHLPGSSVPSFASSIGGLFPGLNFVLTTWYNRDEQNWAVALFFAGATLAGAFGGMKLDYIIE